ncbi:WD40-repeat-containing domain protein, partial [Spinellus fusiger]
RLCTLPLEVLTQIVVYVDIDSLLTLSRTCHLWNNLCGPSHHSLWSLLLKRDYSKQMFHTSPYTTYKYNYCLDKKWKKGRPDITRFIGHDDTVYCMAWLGKDYLVSGSRDASIKRWRLSNASLVSTHTEHQGSVMCLRVSKDQSFMVTGSSDSTCIVWSLPSCTPQQRFHQHQAGILDVCISLNYIVSASKEGAVWVWTQHGKALHSLVGHTGSVQSLAAYGDTIVSASEDATLRVWDIATGTCLATLKGHVMGVTCVLIHNNLIYSGGHDGRIKVWNNYECIMTMVGHSQLIRTLAVYE